MSFVKHPAFILGFRSNPDLVSALQSPGGERNYFEMTHPHLVIAQRNQLDGNGQDLSGDPSIRQVLPYVTLVKVVGNEKLLFVYRRTKKVGEERLGMKYSIGFGGHIEMDDILTGITENNALDQVRIIRSNVMRELDEEIVLADSEGNEVPARGFLNYHAASALDEIKNIILLDTSPEILHAGLHYEVQVNDLDVAEVEDELESIGWFTPEQLVSSEMELEAWSKYLVQNYYVK